MPITIAAKRINPPTINQGRYAGSAGTAGELMMPAAKPAATSTKTQRRTISATLDMNET